MFGYIWGILKNNKWHLYRINGVEDHFHILISLHPSIALSNFGYWQNGYGAFTYSYDAKDNLILYIKNQEEHHKNISFMDEYKILLGEFDIEIKENYFN